MSDPLDKLEELAKAATPGPWYSHNRSGSAYDCIAVSTQKEPDPNYTEPYPIERDWTKNVIGVECDAMTIKIVDADFIAAANPATVLALIEIVRAQYRGLDDCHDHAPTIDGGRYQNCKACETLTRTDALLSQLGGE